MNEFKIREFLIRVEVIASLVKAVCSGVLAAMSADQGQSPEVRINNEKRKEQVDETEKQR